MGIWFGRRTRSNVGIHNLVFLANDARGRWVVGVRNVYADGGDFAWSDPRRAPLVGRNAQWTLRTTTSHQVCSIPKVRTHHYP